MKIDGGCHCGYITFEGEAEPEKTRICHCTDCQALTGSAFRTVVPVSDRSFRILSGDPTIYVKTADSGSKREQGFCLRCGSPIYSTPPGDGPKVYSLRVGTIRQRDKLVPQTQIWARSKLPWVDGVAAFRSFEKQ
jgi:hypothetical protein